MSESSRLRGARILIVDDEPNIRRLLRGVLEDEGCECHDAADTRALRDVLARVAIDLVLLDVCLPGEDGLAFLRSGGGKQGRREPGVIMMSGHGSIDAAMEAVRAGALDFLEKPLAAERLLVSVENGLRLGRLEDENRRLRARGGNELLGESEAMRRLREAIARAAPTEATVLVTGENGTGKELVARALHEGSARARGPFVRVNCAAIPRELLESELFGHERGAFSGAHARRRGRFELAQGGTLLLDEIGDMEEGMQAKLLRVLEERELTRVGGEAPFRLDLRVLASTNRDLPARVREGSFREDLYYRLAVLPLAVPALREHREDVPLYLEHFLARFGGEHGRGPSGFSEAAMRRLRAHDWPGNVRELRNLVERLVVMVDTDRVEESDLPPLASSVTASPGGGTLAEQLEATERRIVEAMLAETGGNLAEAGRRLGLDRANLYRKVKRLGLRREGP